MNPKPQSFLVDADGNRVGVVLDMREYQAMLEDLASVRVAQHIILHPHRAVVVGDDKLDGEPWAVGLHES